ncbi:MAG: hypothetical protein A2231_01625 [Candidatus Firestonebacteria bacterium RIFOXYA2_FULL_40_8]|nr:MAG: hypothetical protein A2231_01625 [Candidatus Firestonebacteria bacterium RIFOXYA2_FULL_40_8]
MIKLIKKDRYLELIVPSFSEEFFLGCFLAVCGFIAITAVPSVFMTEWSYRFGYVHYSTRVLLSLFAGLLGVFLMVGGFYNLFKKSYYIFDAKQKKLFYGEDTLSKKDLHVIEFSKINGLEKTGREIKKGKKRYWLELKLTDGKKITMQGYFDEEKAADSALLSIKEVISAK